MHYGSFIFGSFLMLFGLSILINVFFGIYIPIIRLACGFFLIYAGISLLTATWFYKKSYHYYSYNNHQRYSNSNYPVHHASSSHYQTVFSHQIIDLSAHGTQNTNTDKPEIVHIKTLFGTSHIFINSTIPTTIITNTTFGTVVFPNHSSTHQGSLTYASHDAIKPKLILYVTTTFGETNIKDKEL